VEGEDTLHRWRAAHDEVLLAYAGQWVAVEGEEIVAHGDDPAELASEARSRGIPSPCVFYVEPPQPGVVKLGL